MKQKRIVYIQKQQGKTIMGIGQTAARYLVEGMELPADRGGGKIGSMELLGDLVYIKKIDAEVDHNPRHPGAETRLARELAQPLPALHPRLLRKINRFLFVPHHAVGARVNPVAMPRNLQRQLIADGVAFPVSLTEGILFVEEDVEDFDPPPAKPIKR